MAPTKTLAIKVVYAALQILRDNGKELSWQQISEEVPKRVSLSEWDRARYEKTGYVRWQSVLNFYSIDCSKANYIVKRDRKWFLTEEGEKALNMQPEQLFEATQVAYRQWKAKQNVPSIASPDVTTDEETDVVHQRELTTDEIQERAIDGIKSFIAAKSAYEFQDLCAALLRGMGYYTPYVSPPGRDGGIDIIAYRDPLGTVIPRIKVQIKHWKGAVAVGEIRQLKGILQKEDVGIFISSGGFTSEAKTAARSLDAHIELIDLERLIELWQTFYHKLPDEDKNYLPLLPVYVVDPKA